MDDRVRLQLPTVQSKDRVLLADLGGIHAGDTERGDERPHRLAHLEWPKVPELDRETAADVAQHVDADPRAREIFAPAAADDHAPPGEAAGRVRRATGDR